MMPGMDQNLRVPGPTPLPAEVREAQSAPMIDHRGTEFGAMLRDISSSAIQWASGPRALATQSEMTTGL